LTKEEQTYYENYFTLFLDEGWKQFIDEIKGSLELYKIEDIKNQEHLNTVKGEIKMLQRVATFEDGIRNAYKVFTEDEDDS